MSIGFMGKAAKRYFKSVNGVSQKAVSIMSGIRSHTVRQATTFEAGSGYRTGVGTSENIVVEDDSYQEALNRIKQLDERMSERLGNVMKQVDELCNTSFIVPETTPKVQVVLNEVRSSMTAFCDVTIQTTQITEMYISQMKSADC